MRADDLDILTVVPNQHRWLKNLHTQLSRAGVPIRDAILADRCLQLNLQHPNAAALNLQIRPLGAKAPAFQRTRHFSIGYAGERNLSPENQKVLRVIVSHLARFEALMPVDLEGFASICRRRASADETLLSLFPFITIERSEVPEGLPWAKQGSIAEVLIRTTARCNQACPFCSAPSHDEPSTDSLLACFKMVADLLPGAMVSLTGGEPTLRKSFLAELTKLMNFESVRRVQIQTNGIRFASGIDPQQIPKSEKLSFFVSLHALDESLYDRSTATKGQLPTALKGIQRILDAGHEVIINTLVSKLNLDHLEEMASRLPESFKSDLPPALHFSVLICPEWNPSAQDHLVRYSEVLDVLDRAVAAAKRGGLDVSSPLSSTHASMPACLLSPQALQQRHSYQIGAGETGYEDFTRPFVKAEACRQCHETASCLGVPRPYAQAFGLDELSPLGDR